MNKLTTYVLVGNVYIGLLEVNITVQLLVYDLPPQPDLTPVHFFTLLF